MAIKKKRKTYIEKKNIIIQDGLCPRDEYGCLFLKGTAYNRIPAHRTMLQGAVPCLDETVSCSSALGAC